MEPSILWRFWVLRTILNCFTLGVFLYNQTVFLLFDAKVLVFTNFFLWYFCDGRSTTRALTIKTRVYSKLQIFKSFLLFFFIFPFSRKIKVQNCKDQLHNIYFKL